MRRKNDTNLANADAAARRLRNGIERSRALVALYRGGLLVLRQAMERQPVPPLLTRPISKRR